MSSPVGLMLSLRPGKKFVRHKVLEYRAGTPTGNPCPSLRQFSLTNRLSPPCGGLIREASRLAITLSLKPEVIPVNTASLVNAHFRLLSRGLETETLQRSK